MHAGKKITAALLQQMQKLEIEEIEVTEADLEGAFTRRRHRGPAHAARWCSRPTRRSRPRVLSVILDPESQVGSLRGVLPRARRDRADDVA